MSRLTRNARRLPVTLVLVGALAVLACGAQPLAPQAPAPVEPGLSQVLGTLDSIAPRSERPVLVGVSGQPPLLFAYGIGEKKVLWRKPIGARSVPVVAGELVLIQEKDAVVALRLADGGAAFSLDDRGKLVGADSDGVTTVVTLDMGVRAAPRGLVIGVKDGTVLWRRTLPLEVGVPAVAARLAIVPWANQRLSLLDLQTGEERGRVELTDTMVSHAVVNGDRVYAGALGLLHVGKGLASGKKADAAFYEPVRRQLPAQLRLFDNANQPVREPGSAANRIRLLWSPRSDGAAISFEDAAFYLLFQRFIFAVAADRDELLWLYVHDADIVGAEAKPGGVLAVDDKGQAFSLTADGGRVGWSTSLGVPVTAAAVRSGGFALPLETPGAPLPLPVQLVNAALLDDDRLGPARAAAATYLARIEDEAVTGKLIELCSNSALPAEVKGAACAGLAERTNGAKAVREALARQASFLEGEPVPPSGALAAAAVKMQLRAVVPDLLRHLADPATPSAELTGILRSLAELGNRSTAAAIDAFLRLYHAQTHDTQLAEALGAAVLALVKLEGEAAKSTLDFVAADTGADMQVREQASKASAALGAEKARPAAAPTKNESEPPAVVDKRPEGLTSPLVQNTFQPILKKLKACLPEKAPQVKLTLIVYPSGEIQRLVASPVEAEACVGQALKGIRFPAVRKQESERVLYLIRR